MIAINPNTRGFIMPRSPSGRPGCAGPCTPRLVPRFTLFSSRRTGPPPGRHRPTGSTIARTVNELRQKCGVGVWVRPEPFVRPEPAPVPGVVTA